MTILVSGTNSLQRANIHHVPRMKRKTTTSALRKHVERVVSPCVPINRRKLLLAADLFQSRNDRHSPKCCPAMLDFIRNVDRP